MYLQEAVRGKKQPPSLQVLTAALLPDLNRKGRRQLPAGLAAACSPTLAKWGTASRNEEAKCFKRQALESASLGWHKRESPLILGLGFTVLLDFSGPLKLIFAAQQGWRPAPWQTSVPSVCWKAIGANVLPPGCIQTGFLPNQSQTHPEEVPLRLGQGKGLSSQLRQLHVHHSLLDIFAPDLKD